MRDNDLRVIDLERREQIRLSNDGEPGVVFNAATDWVYWEEIWGRRTAGHWWNRDGSRLAYYHFDDREVPVYTLLDTRSLYPELERQRYPKAGETLPRVEIRVADLESGRTVRLATEDGNSGDVYLARVHWHPDGRRLAVERLNRRQDQLDVLLCDSSDGSCRKLVTQTWPTWVNLGDDFVFLRDGRFFWSSEESGWRQLYLYDADGLTRLRLTPDNWAVTSLEAVHESEGWFLYTAHSTGPLGAAERHVFMGTYKGETPNVRRLTTTPGWHGATVSIRGHWVDSWSDSATPFRQTIRHLRDNDRLDLPRREPKYDLSRLPRWEYLTLPGPESQKLPAALLKPAGFESGRKYPALMYHYGGPGSQAVENRWNSSRPRFLWHLMMAERGYAVLVVDNEGSTFFGKHGEDKLHRRFGEIELAAQLAGAEYLAGLDWVDETRIGLWGWSGGGTNTLYSMLRRPGVWKAAMAGAPVSDWRYYDAIWTERYLGRPHENVAGYKASAVLTYAAGLEDDLLLVHGTADDNVHPQNTLNLARAFIEAGVQFELGLYPGARHSLQTFTEEGRRHVFERMTAFFDRHLRE